MFKKGDLVSRIKYHHDIIFEITKILKSHSGDTNAILVAKNSRLIATAPFKDLVKESRETLKKSLDEKQQLIYRNLPFITREAPINPEGYFKKN